MRTTRLLKTLLLLMTSLLVSSTLVAQTCDLSPVATDDAVEYRGEEILWVDVMANDGAPAGEEVEVILNSDTCPGQVDVEFGSLRIDLPINETDGCSVTYSLREADGDSATATVQVKNFLIFADPFNDVNLKWSECAGC